MRTGLWLAFSLTLLGCGDTLTSPVFSDSGVDKADAHVVTHVDAAQQDVAVGHDAAALDDATRTDETSTACTGRVPMNHRPLATMCPTGRAAGMTTGLGNDGCTVGQGCNDDTDCTAGQNGRCTNRGFGAECSLCSYDQCDDDQGCSGVPCVCRASAADLTPNACATGSGCRLDSDCGPCGYCSPSVVEGSICSGNTPVYECHTPKDTCADDSDCTDSTVGTSCSFDTMNGYWACARGCVQPP